ncbi:hypothetical protein EXS54_03035 [Patescibacteria group bacterium]|nr:hypothetical protein [Patescibacteria group bacterium]
MAKADVGILTSEEIEQMRRSTVTTTHPKARSLSGPQKPLPAPKPEVDLSSYDLSAEGWRESLPLEKLEIEEGIQMAERLRAKPKGLLSKMRPADLEMLCACYVAFGRCVLGEPREGDPQGSSVQEVVKLSFHRLNNQKLFEGIVNWIIDDRFYVSWRPNLWSVLRQAQR